MGRRPSGQARLTRGAARGRKALVTASAPGEQSSWDDDVLRADSANPRVPAHLLLSMIVEAGVLAGAGIVLFFAPGPAHDIWGWELTPFNTRFLAAVYFASLVAVAALILVRRSAPARLVVPMVFVFTAVVLVVSLVYVSDFTWERPVTWAWFLIFVSVPADAAYFLWKSRRAHVPVSRPVARRVRLGLLAVAAAGAGYGIGLLSAPGTMTSFWPWPIDAFHGRLYSAVFFTLAVGAAVVARGAAPVELATLGFTWAVLGVAQPIGLLVVDADTNRVDWTRAGTWGWIAIFLATLLIGVALTAAGRRRSARGARVAPT